MRNYLWLSKYNLILFSKDNPSSRSLGEHFLGAKKNKTQTLVCRNSLPLSLHTPFLSNQAKPMKWWCGGGKHQKAAAAAAARGEFKLHHKTRASEGSIYSKSSFTQTVSIQEGAAHLNIHTFLHLKTSLLYFKGKIKDPPNPFQKNPIIIITIIKNPIRNHKEALRVWVLHSSSMLFGFFFNWWLYTYF